MTWPRATVLEREVSGASASRAVPKELRGTWTIERVIPTLFLLEDERGGGARDSRVTLQQLGIKDDSAKRIVITHAEVAPSSQATSAVPGMAILVKDPNTIVFSICNGYFEAKRTPAQR